MLPNINKLFLIQKFLILMYFEYFECFEYERNRFDDFEEILWLRFRKTMHIGDKTVLILNRKRNTIILKFETK